MVRTIAPTAASPPATIAVDTAAMGARVSSTGINWCCGPEDAAGPVAQERLAAVRAEAEDMVGRPLTWERVAQRRPVPTSWGDRLVGAVFVVVLVLLLIGAVSFLAQGGQTVSGWFGG